MQRLSQVHVRKPRLHECADAVFVSIFVVLEAIIDRLSMKSIDKAIVKLKGHADKVRDALELLGERIAEFQTEVDICAQERMGRIEEQIDRVAGTVGRVEQTIDTLKTAASEVMESIPGRPFPSG